MDILLLTDEMIMKKEKPEYLYKYCPINRHTLDMISSNEAYFSLPKDFNDPFDCNIIPEIVYTKEEHIIVLNTMKGRLTSEEYKILEDNPTKAMEQAWEGTINNIRNSLRIFCLSAINNNVMMYSHYADSHKGICLEFLVSDDLFYNILEYVHYRERIPVFSSF